MTTSPLNAPDELDERDDDDRPPRLRVPPQHAATLAAVEVARAQIRAIRATLDAADSALEGVIATVNATLYTSAIVANALRDRVPKPRSDGMPATFGRAPSVDTHTGGKDAQQRRSSGDPIDRLD